MTRIKLEFTNTYLFFRAKLEVLRLVEVESRSLKEDILSKGNLLNTLQSELVAEKEKCKRLILDKKETEHKYQAFKETQEAESEKLANELRSNKEHYEMAIKGICFLILST